MRIRPTVALAFVAGYLLGTRAGRESYDEIARQARLVWDRPEVQSVAGIVSAQVGGIYSRAAETLSGHGRHVSGPDGHRHARPKDTPSSNGVGAATIP
ncbi:hypothetical protein [Frankia nepalensis]|uniref:hypothetical protein n=1 Tax=Frankia nepalensis TaxID=1836974 RepID=UPI001EE3CA1A|nr:hypothetical protein [Frankia nepalensis]